MNKKARSHKAAGIKKIPSEAVYPGDILSDAALLACTGLARGAWLQCLLPIWRDGTDRVTGDLGSFSRQWGMTTKEVEQCIREFLLHKPCNVEITERDTSQKVTESHNLKTAHVTLINRRKERVLNNREQGRKRKEKERKNKKSQKGHGNVKGAKALPSSSPSFSSSPSVTEVTIRGKSAPPVFLSELNQQLQAVESLIKLADNVGESDKGKPDARKEARQYRNQRKALLKQIAEYNTNPNQKDDHESTDRTGETGKAA